MCEDSARIVAMVLYGRSKLAWLKTFLELPNGIPSHDTFRRVFMLIDPDTFEAGFTAWVGSLTAGFEREVVTFAGLPSASPTEPSWPASPSTARRSGARSTMGGTSRRCT